MNLTKISGDRINRSFDELNIPKCYSDPILNYILYRLNPGSFFRAAFANDFIGAICHSHPDNNIFSLKNLCIWIINSNLQGKAFGSYEIVDNWMKTNEDDRRKILEDANLIFTSKDEVWFILKETKLSDI